MGSTISLIDFEKFSDNVYEAIIIIAKRARQINDEQRLIIEQMTGVSDSDNEENDEEDVERFDEINEFNFPKPTQLALQEFFEGKIKYDYGDGDKE